MTYFQALLLGIVQGLTEFLPISSSGHLVIGQYYLGLRQPELLFDVAVHFGTFLAVVVYFRREVYRLLKGVVRPRSDDGRLAWLIALGTVPAVFAGALLNELVEDYFGSPDIAAFMLILTGLLLVSTLLTGRGVKSMHRIKWFDAILVGVAQACAIMPGLSRSGSTIVVGLFLGIKKVDAARFSFLLSLPAIFGAVIWEGRHIGSAPNEILLPILAGTIAAGLVGYLSIAVMLKVVSRGKLYYFAPYCFLLAIFVLAS